MLLFLMHTSTPKLSLCSYNTNLILISTGVIKAFGEARKIFGKPWESDGKWDLIRLNLCCNVGML